MSGEAMIDVVGNLGADPDHKHMPSGDMVVNFSIACTPSVRNEKDEWTDGKTIWYRVSAFKKDAERVANNVFKGDRVRVTGALTTEEYKDKSGQNRTSLNIHTKYNGVSKILKADKPVHPDNRHNRQEDVEDLWKR